jgi:catalase-peroxidase
VQWDNSFFEVLFGYDWDLVKSPAEAWQWVPTDPAAAELVPDAHDPAKRHAPIMLTTDLALRMDPAYEKISRRFLEHPEQFAEAFAKAWFKLTHRDMGPYARGRGALVPASPEPWQDPLPAVDHPLIDDADVAALKAKVLASGLSVAQLVRTAWASAATFRGTDKRGGANGARLRLAPQREWEVNDPAQLAGVLDTLDRIRTDFDAAGGKRVSLADLIVLAGCAAVEQAAAAAGVAITVPFTPGRTDADQAATDVESFAVLEPRFDGFRNFVAGGQRASAEELLVEKAALLTLTAPEMTVLVGGMRALAANVGDSRDGVFTDRPGTLSNDFFVNLLDIDTVWTPLPAAAGESADQRFEGRDRRTGAVRFTASRVDLVFGSNSRLRALAEVYAADDAKEKFVRDFVRAWDKVMSLDRFDLNR